MKERRRRRRSRNSKEVYGKVSHELAGLRNDVYQKHSFHPVGTGPDNGEVIFRKNTAVLRVPKYTK